MNKGSISDKRYPALERLAVGLVLTVFLIGLLSRAGRWNWLFDSAYLLAGAYVASQGARAGTGSAPARSVNGVLLVSIYLFLDSAVQMLVGFCFPGAILLVYILLTGLYGAALAARLREHDVAVAGLPWARLLQPPALYLTAAVLTALGCLYMPMLHFYWSNDFWVPTWLTLMRGNMAVVHPPRLIHSGVEIPYRGIEVAFSRVACLSLAAIGAAQLLRLGARVPAAGSLRLMRAAAIIVGLWWLVPGRGYRSLDNLFDLLFVAALGVVLVILFGRPDLLDGRAKPIDH